MRFCSLYSISIVSQPKGRAPPKAHQIKLRGHEMINGRGKKKKQNSGTVHKSVFSFWRKSYTNGYPCLTSIGRSLSFFDCSPSSVRRVRGRFLGFSAILLVAVSLLRRFGCSPLQPASIIDLQSRSAHADPLF